MRRVDDRAQTVFAGNTQDITACMRTAMVIRPRTAATPTRPWITAETLKAIDERNYALQAGGGRTSERRN